MLDGFNQGWLDLPEHDRDILKGGTSADEVIADLMRRDALQHVA